MIFHPDYKPKESEIQRQIIEWLEWSGCLVIRFQNIGIPLKNGGYRPVRKKGIPDIIAFIPRKKGFPVPIMVEVKSAKGKTTPEQERFLADADNMKIVCIVARSLDFVKEQLKKYL